MQIIFYFLWDLLAYPGYFENRIPIKPALVERAYVTSQTTVLHIKRLNQTESPIFVILCVLCFQRQSFWWTFILFSMEIMFAPLLEKGLLKMEKMGLWRLNQQNQRKFQTFEEIRFYSY